MVDGMPEVLRPRVAALWNTEEDKVLIEATVRDLLWNV